VEVDGGCLGFMSGATYDDGSIWWSYEAVAEVYGGDDCECCERAAA
jgi:hypothetical protein